MPKQKILNIKSDFPVLVNNPTLVYLDSCATTLKPQIVIDKINEYYTEYGVNVNRGVYYLSYKATVEYEETRDVVAKFINALPNEIVYTKGTSNSLNIIASSYGMENIKEGDEIITSELEHHSSVLPWQNVANKKGAHLKFIELDSLGRITVDAFKAVLSNKTKVVALTYVSNVMGYITPIKEIIKLAHEVGAIVIVDAAQAAPHMRIDVKDLNVDFLAMSAHKMLGPTGFGILYGKYKLLQAMEPVEFGGDMNDYVELYESQYKDAPHKFETGTPAIAEAIAFKEAIKYLENIGFEKIHNHEQQLLSYAISKLSKIEGIKVYNLESDTNIITFNIRDIHPHDVASFFDEGNIAVRAGHHCAQLITKWLEVIGTLRACIYIYNDYSDIDQFINVVKQAADYFKEW